MQISSQTKSGYKFVEEAVTNTWQPDTLYIMS